jgi:hypothetical protein
MAVQKIAHPSIDERKVRGPGGQGPDAPIGSLRVAARCEPPRPGRATGGTGRHPGAGSRRELVSAQHPRRLLTYALPHLAVEARIELARAHLALADRAGARTLMREVDDLLGRRPGLGTLVTEAGVLRAQLASPRGSSVPERRR